ncbi:MAG: C-terminal helicase domain-containing protein, partial [Oscillospiraceae bacterium]
HITAAAIHGNKSQSARQQALADFKAGRIQVLVATDIAARGIDIEDLSHVVNYNLPDVPETYVHRIGRTGRAKRHGVAYSLVVGITEAMKMDDIAKNTHQNITLLKYDSNGCLLEVPKPEV